MNRLAWVAVSVALVLGLIAGVAYIGTRAQKMEAGSAAETCAPPDVEGISLLETALRAYSDLSFRSGYAMGPLHGPFNDLRIVSVEVDGPGFERAGDVGVWAIAPGVPPGWVGGAILCTRSIQSLGVSKVVRSFPELAFVSSSTMASRSTIRSFSGPPLRRWRPRAEPHPCRSGTQASGNRGWSVVGRSRDASGDLRWSAAVGIATLEE